MTASPLPNFFSAHATHPDGHMALALAAAQIEAQRASRPDVAPPTLGWLYFTETHAPLAEALLDDARQRWPGAHWVGGVGVGVLASGVEYFDEPGLVLMLAPLPAGSFQVFNGRQPLPELAGADLAAAPGARAAGGRGGHRAHSALVHADPATPDLDDLLRELADRTHSGYLFGGLTSSRGRLVQLADGVFTGGLSGVAFDAGLHLVSRVTQGCQPVGPARQITQSEGNLVLALDGAPALPLLLSDLGLSLARPQQAVAGLRRTLAGLTDGHQAALTRGGQFGSDTRVRHLVGIDPARQGVALADVASVGQQLSFCRRDVDAARRDLVRICAEIRDELDAAAPQPPRVPSGSANADTAAGRSGQAATAALGQAGTSRIVGALYVSCTGRGGPHFGGPSAEALLLQHALGDVPLVGFFAAGEVARHHLYGYTGVLTVFASH